MGIGGTGIGGGAQPPTARELDTTAFNEVMKKVVMAMLPADTMEVVPFTQGEYDAVFKYRSEPERPRLNPLLHVRHADVQEARISDQLWKPVYENLVGSLPADIQEWLDSELVKQFTERDPNAVMLNNVLLATAVTVAWLEAVASPHEVSSMVTTENILNAALPFVALRTTLSLAETVLDSTGSWLNHVGANYPHHDALVNILRDAEENFEGLNALRQQVESGNDGPEVRQGFLEIANNLERLAGQHQTAANGSDAQILGTTINALATIAGAWALSEGSPSLLLGLNTALIGFSTTASETGVIGNSLDRLTDSMITGLLETITTGPGAELAELEGLLHDLNNLPPS